MTYSSAEKVSCMNDLLAEGLRLKSLGFSLIPVGQNKKSLCEWKEVQERHATEDEIRAWFARLSPAAIGIVTGEVSGGLIVIDVDTPENPWPEDPEQRASLSKGAGATWASLRSGPPSWQRMPRAASRRSMMPR